MGSHPKIIRYSWLSGLFVAVLVAATLLATNSLGTYQIAGRELTGMNGWPQPIGWIAQVLVIESWPTYRTVEVRWLAWAIGALFLVGLAVLSRRRLRDTGTGRQVFSILVTTSVLLVVLVAVRALLSTVVLVGLIWTWQLALGLLWMVALYVWTVRLQIETLARAIAIGVVCLALISLLFCIQGKQMYPNWPTGNVLLLATGCLVAVFLLGTWAYAGWIAAQQSHRSGDYLKAVGITLLFTMVAVALSMTGRRAGVLGLAAGGVFLLIMTLWRRVDLARSADVLIAPVGRNRMRLAILSVLLLVLAAGAVAVPRLLRTGRWQTVQFRVEMYKAGAAILLDRPLVGLMGVAPGHVGFELTTRLRPLHAASPRLYHGEIAEQVHSEPFQAILELGLPLGLVYLLLPLGGLLGFAVAYRKTDATSARLTMLGAGAALAAALAAEATGVGMRHPDVAMQIWALAGMGWACGATAGGFAGLMARLRPVTAVLLRSRLRLAWSAAGVAAGLVLVAIAWQSVRASGWLYQAKVAWSAGEYRKTDTLLSYAPLLTTDGAWMHWQYLHGRADLALMAVSQDSSEADAWQAKGMAVLGNLVDACPAYQDAMVWLGKGSNNWATAKAWCDELTKYDPYDREARLVQASLPQTSPVEQLGLLRMALRNASVNRLLAERLIGALEDPQSQQQLAAWMVDADAALAQPDPAEWSDPLALETLRLAVISAAHQGKIAEAYDLSNEAAVLVKYLSADPWRNRLETVEIEVYLDQAWFGWLVRPDAARSALSVLESHIREMVKGAAKTYSERMAAQFAGLLWLSVDRQSEAGHLLYIANPGSPWADLQRKMGLGYARLVSLIGERVPAEQRTMWIVRGKRALGDELWKQVLDASAQYKVAPWWYGVLSSE